MFLKSKKPGLFIPIVLLWTLFSCVTYREFTPIKEDGKDYTVISDSLMSLTSHMSFDDDNTSEISSSIYLTFKLNQEVNLVIDSMCIKIDKLDANKNIEPYNYKPFIQVDTIDYYTMKDYRVPVQLNSIYKKGQVLSYFYYENSTVEMKISELHITLSLLYHLGSHEFQYKHTFTLKPHHKFNVAIPRGC